MPEELHHTSWIAHREVELIDRDAASGAPFFHFLGIADPHHPVAIPTETLKRFGGEVPPAAFPETDWVDGHPNGDRFQRAGQRPPEALREFIRYTAAANALIDDAVGRIVSHLEERGLLENTIIVFTSDHGDFLGDHGLLMKSHSACTALLHTPLIIRGPSPGPDPGAGAGTPGAGTGAAALPARTVATVSNMDVFPTLARLSGGTVPEGLHGRDLVASVESGDPGRAFAFSSGGPPSTLNQTICDDRFRYTIYPHAGRVELYDHIDDRGDTHNVASDPKYRDDVERLGTELAVASLRHTVPVLHRVSEW
jgi:arylsulfatase A-like enzyme